MSSCVSESGISISDKSTTEFSTSGVSLKSNRSKSPFLNFKDEQVSTSELVSAWLSRMETRSIELLDAEEMPWEQVSFSDEKMKHLGMLLHEIGDTLSDNEQFHKMLTNLDAEDNRRRLVRTMPLLGVAGVIIMALLKS